MSETSLKAVTNAMDLLIQQARQAGISPHSIRRMRLFSTKEVCNIIGKSTTTLYNAEESGVIEPPERDPATGRRIGYTPEQVNILRNHFGIVPKAKRNNPNERLGITTALYNFKGGVGKTTTAVNISQYAALQGYRTLLIDMDSQASTTALFGIIADEEISENETVLPYTLYGEKNSLSYAVRPTHFDNLYIIPANQHLSSSEFEAVSQISGGSQEDALEYFQRLKDGIDTIKDEFDFIFVDAPPSLGIIGIQTLLSVDNIIIPCPPRMLDFVSTRQFLETATQYVTRVAEDKTFNSIKVMASMYDRRNTMSREFMEVMNSVLGTHMYANQMLHSESIDNSSAVFQTPWEAEKPDKRITDNMRSLFNEVINDLTLRNGNNG